ncbi:MAG: hypothetical protein ACQESM_10455, partial [Bacteroidota bacterium]
RLLVLFPLRRRAIFLSLHPVNVVIPTTGIAPLLALISLQLFCAMKGGGICFHAYSEVPDSYIPGFAFMAFNIGKVWLEK